VQAFLTSEKWKTLRHLVTDTERTANDLLAEAISLLAEKYREVPLMSPVVVPMTRVVVYRHAPVSHEEFVEFWERQYPDKEREKDERLYDPNIAALHQHTKCTLKQLFEWKFGVRFLEDEALNTHFIDRIECARRQPTNVTPEQFLHDVFAGGGPIHRILVTLLASEISDLRSTCPPRHEVHFRRHKGRT